MGAALGWGSLAAFSLVLGTLLALGRRWPERLVGLVLAFGAGALISAVSFELAEEGIRLADRGSTAAGLAVGALVYYWLDGVVARIGSGGRGRVGRASAANAGTPLALGAFLDHPRAAGARYRPGRGRGGERRVAGGDLRLKPPRGDRLRERNAHRGPRRPDDPAPLAGRCDRVCACDRRRVRSRRQRLRQPEGGDRRLRRRRGARDAGRLDDPRRQGEVRPHGWPRHDAGIRAGNGPFICPTLPPSVVYVAGAADPRSPERQLRKPIPLRDTAPALRPDAGVPKRSPQAVAPDDVRQRVSTARSRFAREGESRPWVPSDSRCSSRAGVSITACEMLAFMGRSRSRKLPARDRHFEGGGRRLYIFSPGRLLACSIQETSWSSSRSSSS